MERTLLVERPPVPSDDALRGGGYAGHHHCQSLVVAPIHGQRAYFFAADVGRNLRGGGLHFGGDCVHRDVLRFSAYRECCVHGDCFRWMQLDAGDGIGLEAFPGDGHRVCGDAKVTHDIDAIAIGLGHGRNFGRIVGEGDGCARHDCAARVRHGSGDGCLGGQLRVKRRGTGKENH